MLVASVKVASEVAVLALYSKYEHCAKHVRLQARLQAGQPLSEAVIGVEKCHPMFLQAMVSIYSQV